MSEAIQKFKLVDIDGKEKELHLLEAVRRYMRKLPVGEIRELQQWNGESWQHVDTLVNDIEYIWHKGTDKTPDLIAAEIW